ncbi:MAG: rhomboid family intramembrane serine protease [bacterium]
MIPLRDNIPSRRFPIINILLIIVNFIVFFYEISLGNGLQRFILQYGIVPARIVKEIISFKSSYILLLIRPFFSAIFIHGGWYHILSNMLYLWIFGDNVEDRMGHFRYLIFYLLCGFTSSIAHIVTNMSSTIPTIGASGAISGVLGAYFVIFPEARVMTLLPLGFFLQITAIPAFLFLGFWFISQTLNGVASLAARTYITGGIAWWAHIGGFLTGIIIGKRYRRRYRPYYGW